MRASELLSFVVVEHDGSRLGRVSDFRIVQDGPIRQGVQAAFRVDALVVGRAGLAERLGYIRNRVNGPWLLKALFTRLEQRAHVVPLTDIEQWDEPTRSITLKADRQAVQLRS